MAEPFLRRRDARSFFPSDFPFRRFVLFSFWPRSSLQPAAPCHAVSSFLGDLFQTRIGVRSSPFPTWPFFSGLLRGGFWCKFSVFCAGFFLVPRFLRCRVSQVAGHSLLLLPFFVREMTTLLRRPPAMQTRTCLPDPQTPPLARSPPATTAAPYQA